MAKYDKYGLYKYRGATENEDDYQWEYKDQDYVGDDFKGLVLSKDLVRMKYKSSPHLVLPLPQSVSNSDSIIGENGVLSINQNYAVLPIVEIVRNNTTSTTLRTTRFGGKSKTALQANTWIPCGEPVRLDDVELAHWYKIGKANVPGAYTDAVAQSLGGIGVESTYDNIADAEADGWQWVDDRIAFQYSYGDTYYQRWDCLKTYAFTPEDTNQVIEIGSFMLETRVNIDGRYDRNRGQLNNLNMSPRNFNLLNEVYSQQDNFFTYKILDDSYYTTNIFKNQFTWTLQKHGGSDIDTWTSLTSASTYDTDGTKGQIVSINVWKDNLFCFQERGISKILFNSRVQIPVTDGVPIEISNNYKVDGHVYLTEDIGCKSSRLIKKAASGIYFIDSIAGHLYILGEDGITDLSQKCNMTSWFENSDIEVLKLLYDNIHKDLYVLYRYQSVEEELGALCYSEILGQFVSFFDYSDMAFIESYNNNVFTYYTNDIAGGIPGLYRMFTGTYCNFFGTQYPWYFSFISNGTNNKTAGLDRIFTNIEYKMDMYESYTSYDDVTLDTINVNNEYQSTGEVTLSRLLDIAKPKSYHHAGTNLQKKFRIWRIQIPRAQRGGGSNGRDRIRNPWCKITLSSTTNSSKRAVLHDMNVQYYI